MGNLTADRARSIRLTAKNSRILGGLMWALGLALIVYATAVAVVLLPPTSVGIAEACGAGLAVVIVSSRVMTLAKVVAPRVSAGDSPESVLAANLMWTAVANGTWAAADVASDVLHGADLAFAVVTDSMVWTPVDGYGTVMGFVSQRGDQADHTQGMPSAILAARTSPAFASRGMSTDHTANDVPQVDVYPEVFDGVLPRSALVPLTHPALNDPWYVRPSEADAGRATLTPAAIDALNSYAQDHVAVAVRGRSVTAWTDGDFASVDREFLGRLSSALYAATGSLHGSGASDPSDDNAADATEDAEQAVSVGRLQGDSAARAAGDNRNMAGLLTTGLAAILAVVTWVDGRSTSATSAAPGSAGANKASDWMVPACVALFLAVLGALVMRFARDYDGRKRAVAVQALALARGRGWRFRQRDVDVERGWVTPPFSRVSRLTASPSASAVSASGLHLGVAYLEGDLGVWPFLKVFSSRAVWAQLPGVSPKVDLVREGFATSLAKLVGGTDVDVESYAFNKKWRVKADSASDAHALLAPTVIDVLNDVAEQCVAFRLDGSRVVLWDDGTAKDVDLPARLALVERFARAVPAFLVTPDR